MCSTKHQKKLFQKDTNLLIKDFQWVKNEINLVWLIGPNKTK